MTTPTGRGDAAHGSAAPTTAEPGDSARGEAERGDAERGAAEPGHQARGDAQPGAPRVGPVAFVLGGGGRLGAAEVGMLDALTTAGVVPDMVLGTSIGAINGAVYASAPNDDGLQRLRAVWSDFDRSGLLTTGIVDRLRTFVATRVSLHRSAELLALFDDALPADVTFEDLAVDFQCVAARVETAAAAWFSTGPVRPALLASSAVPGLFEPVEIDGNHHYDGGLVSSIPLSRAIAAGAGTVYVLQVGRIEQALTAPSNPLQVAQVSFEIARRHGFATMMDSLPDGVDVHVLPSGGAAPAPEDLRGNLNYRDTSGLPETIERARIASAAYLADHGLASGTVTAS